MTFLQLTLNTVVILRMFEHSGQVLIIYHVDSIRHGHTKQGETSTSGRQEVYILFNNVPSVLTVRSSELYHHWTFLASIHVSQQHANETLYRGQFL